MQIKYYSTLLYLSVPFLPIFLHGYDIIIVSEILLNFCGFFFGFMRCKKQTAKKYEIQEK